LGLKDAKPVNTPAVKAEEEKTPLEGEQGTMYRAIVARLNYLAQDRSDIAFAVKEACRGMSAPNSGHWNMLKRIGRYLVGRPRVTIDFVRQHRAPLEVWTDTDYAGCHITRKSTSGGVLRIGKHLIKSWSTTQASIALSSGEAEYYGMVKGAAQALGARGMCADLGINLYAKVINLYTDASAAKGIANRKGVGKIRQLDVSQLWLQDKTAKGELRVIKIDTSDNLADALTKPVNGEATDKHIKMTEQKIQWTKHELALKA
jgi:hypothetical protein